MPDVLVSAAVDNPASEPASSFFNLLAKARPAWHSEASCLGTGTEVFFVEGRGGGLYAEARSICASCGVIERCRLDADQYETSARLAFGFLAGETAIERIRRRRASGTGVRRNGRRVPNLW